MLVCVKFGCYRRNKKQKEREEDDFPQGPKVSLDTEAKLKDDFPVTGKPEIFVVVVVVSV